MNKPKCIIFDLDGTFCELKPQKNNHTGDEVDTEFLYSMYLGYNHYYSIVLTGRKEKFRKTTEKWLKSHDYDFDEVIMQEKSQAEKNHTFKREKLIELQERYGVAVVIDDNPDMIPVCKELGIPLLHVNR